MNTTFTDGVLAAMKTFRLIHLAVLNEHQVKAAQFDTDTGYTIIICCDYGDKIVHVDFAEHTIYVNYRMMLDFCNCTVNYFLAWALLKEQEEEDIITDTRAYYFMRKHHPYWRDCARFQSSFRYLVSTGPNPNHKRISLMSSRIKHNNQCPNVSESE